MRSELQTLSKAGIGTLVFGISSLLSTISDGARGLRERGGESARKPDNDTIDFQFPCEIIIVM